MSFLDGCRYRLWAWLQPDSHQRELAEEFQFHRSLEENQHRHAGESIEQARLASRRRFGNESAYRDEVRQMNGGTLIDAVRQLGRHSVRSLLRSPGFSLAAVVTLALGIGGLTAMGAVVHGVLLKPLPYTDADRLVAVGLKYAKAGIDYGVHSDATYFGLRRLSRTIEDIAAYQLDEVNLNDGGDPERVQSASVTASFFTVLRPVPLLGRAITEADDPPSAWGMTSTRLDGSSGSRVVVISEALWRRRFGGDPAVVGRSLTVGGLTREIIGVLPRSMALPNDQVQLWIPLGLDVNHGLASNSNYEVVARLKPGVTSSAVHQDFQRSIDRLPEIYPDAGYGLSTQQYLAMVGLSPVVRPLKDEVIGDVGTTLWVLVGTAAFVLLVACANVATLFLVRAEARQREMAVRSALGAGRWSITARYLVEGLVLATAGAIAGLGLTGWGLRVFQSGTAVQIPRLAEVRVDLPLVGFVVLITLAVGIGCSLLPANRLKVGAVASALRSGGRGSTGGRDRQRARQALVVAQVALAFALLAGSGLLLRTFLELRRVEPGFVPSNVMTAGVALTSVNYPSAAAVARFYQTVERRLGEFPGVTAVGASNKLPLLAGSESRNAILRVGQTVPKSGAILTIAASGDYFQALKIPMIVGRAWERIDPDRYSSEVVISADLAKVEWGDATGRSAIGAQFQFAPGSPVLTVVGVVAPVRTTALDRPPEPVLYIPVTSLVYQFLAQHGSSIAPRSIRFVARTSGDPSGTAAAIRSIVKSLDPSLPVYDLRSMSSVVAGSLARTTFTSWMVAAAAAIALLLGVIGIYGVVAYTVTLRFREIGLRLALGARPAEVGMMLMRQGMMLVGGGIIAGIFLTMLVTGFLRALLFGVSRNDPLTLIAVAVMLSAASLLATWIPARRAGRVDPAVTLAGE